MTTETQMPPVLSCIPDPQTPVANMVVGRINAFMREKAQLINDLADAKRNCERLERTHSSAKEEFQAKCKDLEETIERLRRENENDSLIDVRITSPWKIFGLLISVPGKLKCSGYRTGVWSVHSQHDNHHNTSRIPV